MSRDKKQWMEFLRTENDYMTYLLEAFEVPETVESMIFKKPHVYKYLFYLINLQMIPMTMNISLICLP
jgi:hypothetical protein